MLTLVQVIFAAPTWSLLEVTPHSPSESLADWASTCRFGWSAVTCPLLFSPDFGLKATMPLPGQTMVNIG